MIVADRDSCLNMNMKISVLTPILLFALGCSTCPKGERTPAQVPIAALDTNMLLMFANLPPETKAANVHYTELDKFVQGKKFFCYDSDLKAVAEYPAHLVYPRELKRSAWYRVPGNLNCKFVSDKTAEQITSELQEGMK